MNSIDPAIHFGFIWNIWKKRRRARNYPTNANSLVCDKSGRSLFIAFHKRATRRKMEDYDFGGMYYAILKVKPIIVSAGIIRIFGKEIAELPLVATSIESQG